MWCGESMPTTYQNKKLDSSRCHVAFHRWRQKALPGQGPATGFLFIETELAKGRHPNPQHPLNNIEEPEYETTH